MDAERVDPQVRAARRMPDVPVYRLWGRLLVRAGVHLLPRDRRPGVRIRRVRRPRLRVYQPVRSGGGAGPALLWFHGGGLVVGAAVMDDRLCATVAEELGITVVSADYRLAPRHPFPAAHQDALIAWQWLQDHAEQLGVDPDRVALGGGSAGGNLAAGLVLHLVDMGGVQPVAQWLFAPMLDDRTATRRELDAIKHWVWDNRSNHFGWSACLGTEPGSPDVSDHAAPARRTDLSGLPPTWVSVGGLDLFLAEDVAYAERLTGAGVPVTLEVVPDVPHGFEGWAPEAEVSRAVEQRARAWLAAALG